MKLFSDVKNKLAIAITFILLASSLLSIMFSHQLIAAVTPNALNGIETRFQLNNGLTTNATERPVIITAIYSTCAATCPANVNVLRQFQNHYSAEIDYLFITLNPDQDSMHSLQQYLKAFSPDLYIYRPADDKALQQLMNTLPEGFLATNNANHHAGYIYLSHPNAAGLITYQSPTYQQIIDDLMTLQLRGK